MRAAQALAPLCSPRSGSGAGSGSRPWRAGQRGLCGAGAEAEQAELAFRRTHGHASFRLSSDRKENPLEERNGSFLAPTQILHGDTTSEISQCSLVSLSPAQIIPKGSSVICTASLA